jgi:hypothetical protein
MAGFRPYVRKSAEGQEFDFVGASTRFADGSRLLVARHYKDISEFLRITLTVLVQGMLATIVLGAVWAAIARADPRAPHRRDQRQHRGHPLG